MSGQHTTCSHHNMYSSFQRRIAGELSSLLKGKLALLVVKTLNHQYNLQFHTDDTNSFFARANELELL